MSVKPTYEEFLKNFSQTKTSDDKGDLYTATEKGYEPGKGWKATAITESGIQWELRRCYSSRYERKTKWWKVLLSSSRMMKELKSFLTANTSALRTMMKMVGLA